MGMLFGQGTYLKQLGNVIDLIVIIFGIWSYVYSTQQKEQLNVTSILPLLRLFRLLKPLRVLGGFSRVQIFLKALTESIKSLTSMLIILLIFMLTYAGLGVNIFKGQLESRCRLEATPPDGNNWPVLEGYFKLCGQNSYNQCPEGSYCGNAFDYNLPFE